MGALFLFCAALGVLCAIMGMRMLLAEPELARHLGEAARLRARERFNICRFADDWDKAFRYVTQ